MKIWKDIKNNSGNFKAKLGWTIITFLSRSELANKLIDSKLGEKAITKLEELHVDEWCEEAVTPTCPVCSKKMELDEIYDSDERIDKVIYSCEKEKIEYVLEKYFKFYYLFNDSKFSENEIKRVSKLKAFW